MATLLSAFFLALVTNQIIDGLAEPIRKKWPDFDLWFLVYVTWVLGGLLAYLASTNLFADLIPTLDPNVGRVLTAIITGGGSRLLHSVFDRLPTTSITTTSSEPGLMTATVRTDTPPPADPVADVRVRR